MGTTCEAPSPKPIEIAMEKQSVDLSTERVAAQAIEPGGVKSFQLTPVGQGVVAWRYKGGD